MTRRIDAVVLAAGRSTRMGEANKLTLTLRGKPLVCHVVDALLAAGVDAIHVVTGHQEDAVAAALEGRRVSFVHNRAHATGMASSIAAGVEAARGADGVLLCLGDMPDLPAELVADLVAAATDASSIALPVREGRRGHPVLFGTAYFDALAQLEGDAGARSVLERNPDVITEIAVADPGIHRDIDTPEDLGDAQRSFAR